MLLVEEATDTSLLSACRHYGYYIANRGLGSYAKQGLCGRHRRRRRRNSENLDVLSLSLQEHPARCPPDADSETRTARRLCWDCWNAKVAKEDDKRAALGPEIVALVERFLRDAETMRKCQFCKRSVLACGERSQLLSEGMIEVGSYGNAFVEYLYPNLS